MKRSIATVVGAGAIASLALVANAQGPAGPPPGSGPHGEGFGQHMVRALNLTDAQKAAWQALLEEHRAAAKPLMEEHRKLRDSIQEQLESAAPDATRIGELMISGHKLMTRFREARQDLEGKLLGLLDAQQKARFETLKDLREDLGPGKGRHHGPFGRGPRGIPEADAQDPDASR
jgi:Spy/CpxP family protein refolding chaperone